MRVQRTGGRALAAAAVALGVAAGGALLGPAGPARAVPVPAGTSATTGYDSISPKFDTATCPTGQVVLSGDGRITDGGGNVVLSAVVVTRTTVRVTAAEVVPYSGNWSVTAIAVCGPDDDEFAVTYAIDTGTEATMAVTAYCPAGKRLYGTGYELRDTDGQVFPSAVRPDGTLSAVTVRADARRGFSGEWTLVAYGVCGKAAERMHLVAARSGLNPSAPKAVTTEPCPGDTNVHGVGFELSGGQGDVVLTTMAPSSAALTAAAAGADEYAPVAEDWAVASYAICSS